MRFRTAKYMDRRTRKWFAFFSVTIGRECRWLEMVHAEQEYQYIGGGYYGWFTIRFINE